jgi:hypothetical protein
LLKLQTTTLTAIVTGLRGIGQDVPLTLVNNSPATISMGGGNEQRLTIRAGEEKADGTYTTERELTGIQPGGFRITGTVRWTATSTGPGRPVSDPSPIATRGRPSPAQQDAYTRAIRDVDETSLRWDDAWREGVGHANRGKVKSYNDAVAAHAAVTDRWSQASRTYGQDATDLNRRAAQDDRAKALDAADKVRRAQSAVIDSLPSDAKAAVQRAGADVTKAVSQGFGAQDAYLNAFARR